MKRKIVGVTVGTPYNPRRIGEQIENGKSAYELAVNNGFEGTEAEWLESLHGKPGKDGYTPQKGIDYFDGAPGEKGEPGSDGKDGYTPQKGIDYFDGVPGKDGEKGDPG